MNLTERTYLDPEVNIETKAYWEAAKEGKLLVKVCHSCSRMHYYPRAHCPHCLSGDTEWTEVSGKGTIYTYSVMRRTDKPYVIAYVTLDEGVTMLTNIVECDADTIDVGDAVEVVFRETEGGFFLPVFRPI